MEFNKIITHSPLVQKTAAYAQFALENAEGGHDWQHIRRVVVNADKIAATEKCDRETVLLAALLHDIADSKFHDGDEEIGPVTARNFLIAAKAPGEMIDHVEKIIRHISYKGGQQTDFHTIELAVVRDADRLDAIGAVGIARAFSYGGFKNRKLFDPAIKPVDYPGKEAYKASTAPTINHFYEKLLKLKNLMHTHTGIQLAEQRHAYMLGFLEEFFQEVQFGGFEAAATE